ncbi:hypothetical protein C4588_02130 [Candidatus Parcubacteria bacterium]|nr:MAG: hypothetical protein C4588_02130 [Candidatus Parcubacteria bacterium]
MKQTKLIIKMAIQAQERIIEETPLSRNQIERELQLKAIARLELLRAVEQSLSGNHVLLRTYL